MKNAKGPNILPNFEPTFAFLFFFFFRGAFAFFFNLKKKKIQNEEMTLL
jgi:hypothetical protein